MKNRHFRPSTAPLALLIYCLISFGLLIPWLGFYWDDWPSIYYLHVLGPRGFIDAFATDRPPLGWLFMLTSSIMGESRLAWQIFGLLSRWLSSLALWWTLKSLWPEYQRQATWVALLFAAYPGFLQQYIAVTYSHTWLVLAAFLFSLGTMIWANRKPGYFWPLTALSCLLSAWCMFTDEYFFGLELLRPLILWLVLQPKGNSSIKRLTSVAIRWMPFAAIITVFLIWRLFIHFSPRGQVRIFEKLSDAPFAAIQTLVATVIQDIAETSLMAWSQVLNIPRQMSSGMGPGALYLLVTGVSIALALIYLSRFETPQASASPAENPQGWSKQAIILGLAALLVAGIPFWVTNLPIELRFPWDRFTMAFNLGASLLLAGLLELLTRRRMINVLILAGLLGLASGMHVELANLYRREWNSQKALFWQLVWRAPGIQPGTILLSAELPFVYYSDNSLTAPLNWTYHPEQSTRELSYLFYNIESRLESKLAGFNKGQSIYEPYRALYFSGSTSQALAIYYNPPGCAKIVDPATDAKTPQKPLYFSRVLSLSNLGLIQAKPSSPALPPQAYFGVEPQPNWCYYFEKADLARQQGDWEEVARLGEQAFQLNTRLYEVNAPELLAYIEGYARIGNWERARELTLEAHQLTFRMGRILCETWSRIEGQAGLAHDRQEKIDQIRQKLKCADN